MLPDFYKILGVDPRANADEIRHAYRMMALKHHPDRNPIDRAAAEKRMQEINEAYGVLKDKASRDAYDMERHGDTGTARGTSPPSPPDAPPDDSDVQHASPSSTPSFIDFGTIELGQRETRVIIVTNSGGPARDISINWTDPYPCLDVIVAPATSTNPFPLDLRIVLDVPRDFALGRLLTKLTVDLDGSVIAIPVTFDVIKPSVAPPKTYRGTSTASPPFTYVSSSPTRASRTNALLRLISSLPVIGAGLVGLFVLVILLSLLWGVIDLGREIYGHKAGESRPVATSPQANQAPDPVRRRGVIGNVVSFGDGENANTVVVQTAGGLFRLVQLETPGGKYNASPVEWHRSLSTLKAGDHIRAACPVRGERVSDGPALARCTSITKLSTGGQNSMSETPSTPMETNRQVELQLAKWSTAHLNAVAKESSFYASTVDPYFDDHAVSRSDIQKNLLYLASVRQYLTSYSLSNINISDVSDSEVRVTLDKVWSASENPDLVTYTHSQLTLKRIDGVWLITGEHDLGNFGKLDDSKSRVTPQGCVDSNGENQCLPHGDSPFP